MPCIPGRFPASFSLSLSLSLCAHAPSSSYFNTLWLACADYMLDTVRFCLTAVHRCGAVDITACKPGADCLMLAWQNCDTAHKKRQIVDWIAAILQAVTADEAEALPKDPEIAALHYRLASLLPCSRCCTCCWYTPPWKLLLAQRRVGKKTKPYCWGAPHLLNSTSQQAVCLPIDKQREQAWPNSITFFHPGCLYSNLRRPQSRSHPCGP